MVIDTSALVAILSDEPERHAFATAIEEADRCLLSTASLVEVSLVIATRYGPEGLRDLDQLVAKAALELVAVDADQADEARRGFLRYGKGRHAAGLNFGDCFSYALARTTGQPLLFKGADFARTDVAAAWTP
jgi:ribonuclease VapC